MNFMRFGANIIERSSPVGLLAGGLALALAIPPIRRSLRAIAITAVGGVLSISEEAKRITSQSRSNFQGIVAEAKSEDCCPSCDDFSDAIQEVRSVPRQMAVKATAGVLAVKEKAKSLLDDTSKELHNIVQEAKQEQKKDIIDEDEHISRPEH